jgi:hypothetical protein
VVSLAPLYLASRHALTLSRMPGTSGAVATRASSAGGARGSRSFDAQQNPFQSLVPQHVAGANAQDPHPSLRKPCLATLIVAHLCGAIVCEPVHLDRQPGRRTIEIENVRPDRVLPAKAQARQPSFPQSLPEHDLRQAHCAAQLAGAAECFVRGSQRPLHHASHGPPPPLRGGGTTRIFFGSSPAMRGRWRAQRAGGGGTIIPL